MTFRNHMPKMLLEFLPSSPLEGYDMTTAADGNNTRCLVWWGGAVLPEQMHKTKYIWHIRWKTVIKHHHRSRTSFFNAVFFSAVVWRLTEKNVPVMPYLDWQNPNLHLYCLVFALKSARSATTELLIRCRSSYLKMIVSKNFYSSLTCHRENGTFATDTVHPAGLVYDYTTLVACPASSCKKHANFMAALHTPASTPLTWL